jgi:hypothetical protein
MTRDEERHSNATDWLSIVSFGFFLVLLGVIWIITPDCSGEVVAFVKSFHLENVTEKIILPVPGLDHSVVYTAAMQFCIAFGVFHIVILVLRFFLHESLDRKAGTISGIVFWLGAGFFLNMLAAEEIGWFGFLAGLIICIGLLIIVSSLVKLLFKRV